MRKPEADAGIHQGLWYNDENKALCTFAKKPAWTVMEIYWIQINHFCVYRFTCSLVGLPSFSSVYGSVMASKNRSADLGTGGYAASCNVGTTLINGWYGEYGLTSCSADTPESCRKCREQTVHSHMQELHAQEMFDFSSQRYFCFNISRNGWR